MCFLFSLSKNTTRTSVTFRDVHSSKDDIEAFFTDQAQQHLSFEQKTNGNDHWDDNHRWLDNIQSFDSPINAQQSRGVGPNRMSRDSISAYEIGSNLLESNHNRRGTQMPASEIAGIGQATPMEIDLRTKTATIKIQRWYRKIQMRRRMAEAALKR